MKHLRRFRHDQGFTLVELLIAMTSSMIMFGAVAGIFVAVASNYTSSTSRLTESNDAQLLNTWITGDIQSAGPGSSDVNQTSTYNPCDTLDSGFNLVTFSWFDTSIPAQTDVAAYWLQGTVLYRLTCTVSQSGTPSTITQQTVGHSIVASGTSILVSGSKVTVTIGEPNSSFTISATRRAGVYLSSLVPTVDTTGTKLSQTSIAFNLAGDTCSSSNCGTLSFFVFGPQSSAPASCSSGGTQIGTVISVNGSATYTASTTFTPTVAGTYWWYASYSGDTATNGVGIGTSCPASETTVQNATTFSSLTATSSVATGSTASVSAAFAASPSSPAATGPITFYVTGPSSSAPSTCTGASWIAAGTAAVSGNATYSSSYIPATAGDYWWYASYDGDTFNGPSHTICPPTAETIVSSTAPGFSITANQQFTLFPASVVGGAITNFAPNESVTIHLDSASGQLLSTSPASITTDANGSSTGITIFLPAGLVGGSHSLEALGSSGDIEQSNTLKIDPSISFSGGQSFSSLPNALSGGTGADFGASEVVSFHLDSTSGQLLSTSPSTVSADTTGSLGSFTVTLPSGVTQDTHTIVGVGNSSGMSATSNTFTVVPTISSLTTTNASGGTPGLLDSGDTINIAFTGQINATSVCSAWTNGSSGVQTASAGSLITVTNPGTDNILSFTTPPSTCGNFNLGSFDLGSSGYVTSNGSTHYPATFANSTIAYDGTAHILTITLGTLGGSATLGVVASSSLGLALSTNIFDAHNNLLGTYTFTSANAQQF